MSVHNGTIPFTLAPIPSQGSEGSYSFTNPKGGIFNIPLLTRDDVIKLVEFAFYQQAITFFEDCFGAGGQLGLLPPEDGNHIEAKRHPKTAGGEAPAKEG